MANSYVGTARRKSVSVLRFCAKGLSSAEMRSICLPASLAKFDDLRRRSIQHITNSDLIDIQWTQGSLIPIKDGSQRVKRVSSLPSWLLLCGGRHMTDCAKSDNQNWQSCQHSLLMCQTCTNTTLQLVCVNDSQFR